MRTLRNCPGRPSSPLASLNAMFGRKRGNGEGTVFFDKNGNGLLDDSIPFKELESRSRINDIALTTSGDADFSRQIRVTLPIPSRRE